MEVPKPHGSAKAAPAFNAQAFLDSAGLAEKIVEYGRGETIFTQGDPCEDVLYGKQDKPSRVVPKISQETLAEMVGTTRSRVNFFLNKFKKLGFIEYNGGLPLKINSSLLSVVLHD